MMPRFRSISQQELKVRKRRYHNLLGGAALLALAGTVAMATMPDSPLIDHTQLARGSDGCPLEPTYLHQVVIDQTTRYTDSQWQDAPVLVQSAFERLPADGVVQIFALHEQATLKPDRIARFCAPPAVGSGVASTTEGYRQNQLAQIRQQLQTTLEDWPRPTGVDQPSGHVAAQSLQTLLEATSRERLATDAVVKMTLFGDLLHPPMPTSNIRIEGLQTQLMLAEQPGLDNRQDDDLQTRWAGFFTSIGAQAQTAPWLRIAHGQPLPRRADGCLAKPAHRSILLVDGTDPYSEQTWQNLHDLVLAEARDLPADGQLDIVRIEGQAPLVAPEPLISLCAPAAGNGDAVIEAAGRNGFIDQLKAQLSTELPMPARASHSPIMEYVAALMRANQAQETRLILFSDMLFNSSTTMQFMDNGTLSFDEIAQKDEVARLLVDLRGVAVKIYYVRRDKQRFEALQNPNHRVFLVDWLERQGAVFNPADLITVADS